MPYFPPLFGAGGGLSEAQVQSAIQQALAGYNPGSSDGEGNMLWRGEWSQGLVEVTETFDGYPLGPLAREGWAVGGAGTATIVTSADPGIGTTRALRLKAPMAGAVTARRYIDHASPVTVRYRVSSEWNYDWFKVYLNDVERFRDAGDQGAVWKSTTIENVSDIPNEQAKLLFGYYPDGSGQVGEDLVEISSFTHMQEPADDAGYMRGHVVSCNDVVYVSTTDDNADVPGTSLAWRATALTPGPPSLEGLPFADLDTAVPGQALIFDGTVFRPADLPPGA